MTLVFVVIQTVTLFEVFLVDRKEHIGLKDLIVDCDDLQMFETNLKDMEQDWNKKECELRSIDKPVFYQWFCTYQKDIISQKMLKSVRQKACLGNPPIQFTNNANESTSAKINAKVDYKKSEVDI